MMWWYGGHWAFWQAGLMWTGMVIFWGLLLWGMYALLSASRRSGASRRGDEPRRILDERLARGEIGPEEYRRLLDLMRSGDAPRPPASTAAERK